MAKKRLSKEEIAKQFQLPERKSKIATLLKQDDKVYCICRSSDSSQFMIACDNCEEWFHGSCVGINQKQAKFIKNYYCLSCTETDPSLQTRYKGEKPLEPLDAAARKTPTKPRPEAPPVALKSAPVPRRRKAPTSTRALLCDCTNCRRTSDCGTCNVCKLNRKLPRKAKQTCLLRVCLKAKSIQHEQESSSDESFVSHDGMQCYGPGCQEGARIGSKYCSDVCGMKLAANRIFHILPQRIREWSLTPSIADELNKKQLEVVRKGQDAARAALKELDKRHMELDAIIDRAKKTSVDPAVDCEIEDEVEASMYCITCGHEIHSRSAVKHLEKCFNKYESQASFGSVYKTRIDGYNMFCDFYNPASKTYCKRLRILCPEHYKEAKVSNTEVCGCPIVTNVFDLTGQFCRASKKNCVRHYCWEKLRRAEIDMERVRQWLKLDELIESERQIRQRITSRAGVLPLLLHSTFDHRMNEINEKKSKKVKKRKSEDEAMDVDVESEEKHVSDSNLSDDLRLSD